MLVWARETASLSQEEVAQSLGVPVKRIQEWERGQDSPTVSQLRRLADKCKRPLSVFYLPEPPQGFQALRDFRRPQAGQDRQFSPQLAYEVRAAYERRVVALEVFADLGEAPPQLGGAGALNDDPEAMARRLRERLGVQLAQQVRWTNEAFRGWRDAIEASGVLVFVLSGAHHQVDLEEMRGFAIAEDPLPVIVVNGKDRTPGRVFTLLHELTHVALGQSAIENELEAGDALPAPARNVEKILQSRRGRRAHAARGITRRAARRWPA